MDINENNSQSSDVDAEVKEREWLEKEIEVINNDNIIIKKYIEDNISKLSINDGNITLIMKRDEKNTPIISAPTVFDEKCTLIEKIFTFINGKRVIINILEKPKID
jgi:hypothetical protein